VTGACKLCLRRSALLALLAPQIEHLGRGRGRVPELLALQDQQLVDAVCGKEDRRRAAMLLRRFSARAARRRAEAADLTAVCRHHDRFPPRLLDAPDAPALLYLRGKFGLVETLARESPVAIVGSRRASPYALDVACALGRELAGCGVPVVSGMAFGVDAAAHGGALESAGPTVAVLGGGADAPSPRAQRSLYERILRVGLVASEFPPGFSALPWCFPARNRIMAALSAMTVVVEGGDRSGSLITARFAADLGREVGAVPGHVTSALARGSNALLADGACVVRSAADVLDALYGAGQGRRRLAHSARERLEPRLRAMLAEIERGSGTVDALTPPGADAAEVMAALTELELMGLVRRDGGRYVRKAG
jgi:DNA processing protein